MQIKYLAREGMAKAEIARRLGVSRQTVYNHLNRTDPYPKPRTPRPSKLDAFKNYIRTRLEHFDLPATVLLSELRERGYGGGITILRDFVRPLKAEFTRRVIERFETLPGRQAQVDWGECGTITVGGQTRKLYVFVFVLGYSRLMYARFTTSMKRPFLLGCLKEAFERLGVPQELLVDNMRQAIDQHDVTTGTVQWNSEFLDFCDHYGVVPVASPPYWPRVKGKVERGVGYLKRSFLEGRTFSDLEDLNRQLAVWLEGTANVRVHGTTGERPVDRYQAEVTELRRARAVPAYDTRPVEIRKVAPDCHFSFEGVRYSVPPTAAGHTVTVRPEGSDAMTVYLGNNQLVRHRVRPKGSGSITLAEHAEAIRELTRGSAAKAYRRRGGQPRFLQLAAAEPVLLNQLEQVKRVAPIVEVHSLATYERLLHRAVS